jgi:hypothetical protein
VVYDAALEQAHGLSDVDDARYALNHAIDAFCQVGDVEAAQRVVDLLNDAEAQAEAASRIELARERIAFRELSPMEQLFVDAVDPSLAYTTVHFVKAGETAEVLNYLADQLARDQIVRERISLISDWVRLMIVPAREVGGTALISALIEIIEDFDQRFLQGAGLVGQQK